MVYLKCLFKRIGVLQLNFIGSLICYFMYLVYVKVLMMGSFLIILIIGGCFKFGIWQVLLNVIVFSVNELCQNLICIFVYVGGYCLI